MAQARSAESLAEAPALNERQPMWQLLLVFMLPLMLASVVQSASSTMASIWIGRLISTEALGAISVVLPVFMLLSSFVLGVASAGAILVGQAFGAGDRHKLKSIAGSVLGASLLLAVVIAVVGAFAAPLILKLVATPANIIGASSAYATVVFLTLPVLVAFYVYTTIVRGTGDATTPFHALIVSSILSIVVAPLFILGWLGLPKLGIVAIAVAGAVANAAALAYLLVVLRRRDSPVTFDREIFVKMFRVDWNVVWLMLRIGVPTGIQVIMFSLAEIAILSFVNRYGSNATAAYGALFQVSNYVQFPAMAIGFAASTFGAQCIGARREDKLGSVIRSAVSLNYLVGIPLIFLAYLFATNILGVFITDPQALRIAHESLMITLWSIAIFGNSAVLSGIMRSSGAVLWPTIISITAIWGVELPAAYFLVQRFGLDGIWAAYPVAFVAGLAMEFCYYEFVWKRKTHELLV